jgi:hypothetical protein
MKRSAQARRLDADEMLAGIPNLDGILHGGPPRLEFGERKKISQTLGLWKAGP